MRKTFWLLLAAALLLFSSCTKRTDYFVFINNADLFPVEAAFLRQVFSEAFSDAENSYAFVEAFLETDDKNAAAIIINLEALWQDRTLDTSDNTSGENSLQIISRTFFVPQANILDGRTNTTKAACLIDFSETLVPFSQIKPPNIALLVDGKTLADEGYPLVQWVSASIAVSANYFSTAKISRREQQRLEQKAETFAAFVEQAEKPLVQNPPSLISITAAGDFMPGRGVSGILLNEGARALLGGTAAYFEKADIGLINLETSVSVRGTPAEKTYTFRADPRILPPLKSIGVTGALLANNHVFDFGDDAFFDTLDHLTQNSIAPIGAGRSLAEALTPLVFTKDGFEVRVYGLASYPPERSGFTGNSVSAQANRRGILYANEASVRALQDELAQNQDALNVIFFHGGFEWVFTPDQRTRALYENLAQSGAALIIGSHSHTTQGFEWINETPFFWSLGNYVFAGMQGTDGGEEGLLLHLTFAGKTLLYAEAVPVKLSGARADIGDETQRQKFFTRSRALLRS